MHSARSHQAGVDCEKFALVKSSADRSSMNGSKPKLTRVRDDTPCWQIQNFSPARNLRLSGGAGEVTCKFEVKVENTKPGDSVVLLGGVTADLAIGRTGLALGNSKYCISTPPMV